MHKQPCCENRVTADLSSSWIAVDEDMDPGKIEGPMDRAAREMAKGGKEEMRKHDVEKKEPEDKVLFQIWESQLHTALKLAGSAVAVALVAAFGFGWRPLKHKVDDEYDEYGERIGRRVGRKVCEGRDALEDAYNEPHVSGVRKAFSDAAGAVKHKLTDATETVHDAASGTVQAGGRAVGKVEDAASAVGHKIVGLPYDAKHKVQETAHAGQQSVKEGWNKAQHSAEESQHAASDAAGRAADKARWGKEKAQRKGEKADHTASERLEKWDDEAAEAREKAAHKAEKPGCVIM